MYESEEEEPVQGYFHSEQFAASIPVRNWERFRQREHSNYETNELIGSDYFTSRYYSEFELRYPPEHNNTDTFAIYTDRDEYRDLKHYSTPSIEVSPLLTSLESSTSYRLEICDHESDNTQIDSSHPDWLLLSEKLKYFIRFLRDFHIHIVETIATKEALLDALNPLQHLIFDPRGILEISTENRVTFIRQKAPILRNTYWDDIQELESLLITVGKFIEYFKGDRAEAIKSYYEESVYPLEIVKRLSPTSSVIQVFNNEDIVDHIKGYLTVFKYTKIDQPYIPGLSNSPTDFYVKSDIEGEEGQWIRQDKQWFSDDSFCGYKTLKDRYIAYFHFAYRKSREELKFDWPDYEKVVPHYSLVDKITQTRHQHPALTEFFHKVDWGLHHLSFSPAQVGEYGISRNCPFYEMQEEAVEEFTDSFRDEPFEGHLCRRHQPFDIDDWKFMFWDEEDTIESFNQQIN